MNRGKQKITLKSGAVPSNFTSNSPNMHSYDCEEGEEHENRENQSVQRVQRICCDCFEKHNILKVEYSNLRQEYINLEATKSVQISDLENKIEKLKMDLHIQKDHIKHISNKLYRKEQSEKSLKEFLKDLKEQNILSKEAYETLEVITIIYAFCNTVQQFSFHYVVYMSCIGLPSLP